MTGARWIVGESDDPAANLALDEALLRAAPVKPVVWLWRNPPCVVVGRGQRVEREVRQDACARDRIPVLRRASGGGTVFQDHGNLNVTLVMPGPADRPLEAIGELMSVAVADLGLPPMLGDRGLFIGETKLCGFAVFRTKAGLLAHSTLLIATAAERIGKYLTGPPPDPLPLDSHRSPVASLADHGLRSGWRRFRKSCWPPPRGNWAHWKPGSPTGTSGNATEINGVSLSSPALAIPKAV